MHPPILTIIVYLVLAHPEAAIFIRKIVHVDDHFLSASVVDHGAPEKLVAHVPVIDVVVPLFAAFLCKLMCPVVFFASGSFAISVTTWFVFTNVKVPDGE